MPDGWAWCRLGYICSLHDGDKIEKQLQYLNAKHFRGKGTTICNSGKYVAENSYLILVDGENSGEVFYTETAGFQGSTFKILNINTIIFNKYVLYLIRKEQDLLRNSKVGSAIPHLNKQLFKDLLIPIPSFLEQKKLVSTTDKAFNTIDELENNKIELSTVITKTKAKILDLAIHGKLVPQDANEEPASVLLEKLRAEKEDKIAKGELKRDKNDSYIYKGSDNCYYQRFTDGHDEDISEEIPYELPKSWTWSRIKDICTINPKNKLDDNLEVSFIPMALIDAGYTNYHGQETKLWKDIKTGFSHFAENDVAIAKITPCFENKKSVILRNLKNGYGADTTELYIFRPTNAVLSKYILWLVKSNDFINTGVGNFSGVVGQQRLVRDILEEYFVPLPPIAEQNRIVSKIEELFSSLDIISTNLE